MLNSVQRILFMSFALACSACTLGPVQITHERGEVPKVHVDTPAEACKVRSKSKEIKLNCEWKF